MFLYSWLQNIYILQKREKQNAISTKKLGFGTSKAHLILHICIHLKVSSATKFVWLFSCGHMPNFKRLMKK